MEKLKSTNTTLVIIRKNGKILLGQKKRGFAKGTFNGIGGKQDPGETIEQAMIRETQEEIGITPTSYYPVGKIKFDVYYKGERQILVMYVYICTEFDGKIVETEEIIPNWFDKDKIPYDNMLPDDKMWFPQIIAGKHVEGEVVLDEKMKVKDCSFDFTTENQLS